MRKQHNHMWIRLLTYLLLMVSPIATIIGARAESVPLNTTISPEDKAQYDQILTPVMKLYNFVKYTASVSAAIALLFAGINYMYSGNDIRKRDLSKNMMSYTLAGLVIIWGAPFIVQLLV